MAWGNTGDTGNAAAKGGYTQRSWVADDDDDEGEEDVNVEDLHALQLTDMRPPNTPPSALPLLVNRLTIRQWPKVTLLPLPPSCVGANSPHRTSPHAPASSARGHPRCARAGLCLCHLRMPHWPYARQPRVLPPCPPRPPRPPLSAERGPQRRAAQRASVLRPEPFALSRRMS